MRVDVRSFETVSRLAHEGTEQAARSMTRLTGIDATVDVTTLSLVDRADLGRAMDDETFVGVRFGLDGPLGGSAVLAFDRAGSEAIVETLAPGEDPDAQLGRSTVSEVGNIMVSGFVDGWADFLDATIDHTPPEYTEGVGPEILPPAPEDDGREQVFVFHSEIEWIGETVSCYIYLLPAQRQLVELLAARHDDADDAIPIDKLEVFNRMTRTGAKKAADAAGAMAGVDVTAEVSRISFAPIEEVPKRVDAGTYVGTVVEFTGSPGGYLLVLFDEPSAIAVGNALLPDEPEGDRLTASHEAAIAELGNVVTSGFLDGWANVLQVSLDHTPPRLVHDMGPAIVDPLAARLGQSQRTAFLIEATMCTDDLAVESEIYALPDEAELQEALDALEVDRAEKTEADVEQIFGE